MKIYLAGPMSGKPNHNFEAFNKAAAELRDRGHEVVNPAELDCRDGFDPCDKTPVDDAQRSAAMARDLPLLCGCDAVAFLPDMARSGGCFIEMALALYAGKKLFRITYDYMVDVMQLQEFRCQPSGQFFTVEGLNKTIGR